MWPTWTVDFWLGAVWTLIAVLAGAMAAVMVISALPEPPAPPDDDGPGGAPSDGDLEDWLRLDSDVLS
jgi:hypothetical protein